jgi:hypothetical protein
MYGPTGSSCRQPPSFMNLIECRLHCRSPQKLSTSKQSQWQPSLCKIPMTQQHLPAKRQLYVLQQPAAQTNPMAVSQSWRLSCFHAALLQVQQPAACARRRGHNWPLGLQHQAAASRLFLSPAQVRLLRWLLLCWLCHRRCQLLHQWMQLPLVWPNRLG